MVILGLSAIGQKDGDRFCYIEGGPASHSDDRPRKFIASFSDFIAIAIDELGFRLMSRVDINHQIIRLRLDAGKVFPDLEEVIQKEDAITRLRAEFG